MRQREPKAHRRPQACGAGPTIKRHPPQPSQSQALGMGVGPNSATIWTAPTGECKLGALFPGTHSNRDSGGPQSTRRQDSNRQGPRSPATGELHSQKKSSCRGHRGRASFSESSPPAKKCQDLQKRDHLCGSILTGRGTFWNSGNLLDLELGDGYMVASTGYPRKDFQQQERPPQEGVSSPPQKMSEQKLEAHLSGGYLE